MDQSWIQHALSTRTRLTIDCGVKISGSECWRQRSSKSLERSQVWCLVAKFKVFGVIEAVCCGVDEWVQIGKAELSMLDGVEDPELTINSFFFVNVDEC